MPVSSRVERGWRPGRPSPGPTLRSSRVAPPGSACSNDGARGHVARRGGRRRRRRRRKPGAPGIGDPYFPLDGNGGYDVEHYDLDLTVRPRDRRPDRGRHHPRRRHPAPVQLQPGLRRPEHQVDHRGRRRGGLEPRRGRAHRDPGGLLAGGLRVHDGGRVRRRPADHRGRPGHLRLHAHRRRRDRRRPARRRRHLVPRPTTTRATPPR